MSAKKKSLNEVVGAGYGDFWHNKSRYRVLKGGKGSKKYGLFCKQFDYHSPDAWDRYDYTARTNDAAGHESIGHFYRRFVWVDDGQYGLAQHFGFDFIRGKRLYAGQRCLYAGVW